MKSENQMVELALLCAFQLFQLTVERVDLPLAHHLQMLRCWIIGPPWPHSSMNVFQDTGKRCPTGLTWFWIFQPKKKKIFLETENSCSGTIGLEQKARNSVPWTTCWSSKLERLLLLDRQQPIFATKTHNFHSFEGGGTRSAGGFYQLDKNSCSMDQVERIFYGTKRSMIDPQLKNGGQVIGSCDHSAGIETVLTESVKNL